MRKKGVSPVGTGVNTDKEALLPRMTAERRRMGGGLRVRRTGHVLFMEEGGAET